MAKGPPGLKDPQAKAWGTDCTSSPEGFTDSTRWLGVVAAESKGAMAAALLLAIR